VLDSVVFDQVCRSVLQWCCNVLQWCCSGVAVVLQWCCSGVAVSLQDATGVRNDVVLENVCCSMLHSVAVRCTSFAVCCSELQCHYRTRRVCATLGY